MKKTISLGIIALITIIASITNPDKELHHEDISYKIINSDTFKEANKTKSLPLVKGVGSFMIKSQLSDFTKYNNYVLFSTISTKDETISYGLFGNTFQFFDERELFDNKNKETSNEDKIGFNWKKQIDFVDIHSGFISDTYGWKPSLYFKIDRRLKKTKNTYLDIKIVFYNTRSNKTISTHESKFTPYHINKEPFLFKSTEYYKSKKDNINVKIYVDNELAKDFKIKMVDFHETIREEKIKNSNKQKNNGYYIDKYDYQEINLKKVRKNKKSNSKISGVYKQDKDNFIRIIELKDRKIFFELNKFNGKNLGTKNGVIDYIGKSNIFKSESLGNCNFKIIFDENYVVVKTINNGYDCGYGNGVISDGRFKKVNSSSINKLSEKYIGSIGNKYSITMNLSINDDIVKGNYFYNKIGTLIKVEGKITGNNIELNVVNENKNISEKFIGNIDGNKIQGNWYNLSNSTKLNFEAVKE